MGDDVFRDDPTVLALEARIAAMAGLMSPCITKKTRVHLGIAQIGFNTPPFPPFRALCGTSFFAECCQVNSQVLWDLFD